MSPSSGQAKQPPGQTAADDRKWWKSDQLVDTKANRPQRGTPCPKCLMDDLDWDSLFRLHCPNCGYVAECGAFT